MARISKEQQEVIRRKILDVAKEKFTDIGFEKTSTKQIAKEVGIAEGTLFNYFETKTELFFEAFGEEYEAASRSRDLDLVLTNNISEVIISTFRKTVGLIIKLPRGILGEMAIASVKMAKNKPERFKKLMQYDFQFIEDIAQYINDLKKHDFLEEVDEKHFSEMIFSFIGYELLLYMYDSSIKKDVMFQNVRTKIDILVKGYLKGGRQ